MKRADKLIQYNKTVKAIKECGAKMSDKVFKVFNMQKKYDKPI